MAVVAKTAIAAHFEADFIAGDAAPEAASARALGAALGNLRPCGSGRLTPSTE